jgi:hypothetical protein
MAEINKPDYTTLWSSGGAIVAPSNTKIQTGWTAEVPPFQWENWSQNRQDQAIAHLFQKGVSVWSTTGEYYFTSSGERSYVQGSNGTIYVSVADSVNQDPVTDTTNTYWKIAFSDNSQLPFRNFVAFTTPGATTWTAPAGVTKIWVEVYGAGGGGGVLAAPNGVAPAGGGGGGVAKKLMTVVPGTLYNLVVGQGGNGGGASPSNGTAGGASNFASGAVAATGGAGGTSVFNAPLASSGIGTGGDINYRIGVGASAIAQPGGTFLGGAGGGGESPAAAGDTVQPSQAGMGGGGRSTSSAPSGANGAVRIFY